MWLSFLNRPAVRMWLGFLSCHRQSTTIQCSSSPSLTSESAPIQTSDAGISNADASSSTELPSFFALIIGINEYVSPAVRNLEGAVSDALAVKKYLEDDLGVPASQIRFLYNAGATRKAIIHELKDLAADQRVNRGDPILIYYAGYGSEVDAPEGWKAGSAKIQLLIPHDFGTADSGRAVHGIPDRTIGTLLSRIAEKCGDNITVIFDCCYSDSGLATGSTQARIARVTRIPNDLPSDLDLKIWSPEARLERSGFTILDPGFLHQDSKSHVLLAACEGNGPALEEQGSGVFTAALLKLLSVVGAQNVTYANLFQRLPHLTQQSPHCAGFNINRPLFNGKARSRGQIFFKVQRNGNHYLMDAGTHHGIAIGDEFTLYKDPDPARKSYPLAIFGVSGAQPYQSTMISLCSALHFKPKNTTFAIQTKAGTSQDLRLHVAKRKRFAFIFEELVREMQHARPDRPRILRVEKEQAELSIELDGKMVVFNILDEHVTVFNLRRIPFTVQLDVRILLPIIDAAAHFRWYLRGIGQSRTLQNKVRLEFTKVEQVIGKYDEDLHPVIEQAGDNLNQDGVINLTASAQDMYGMKILNNTSIPLHAALFYFDNTDLSITSLFPPSFSGQYNTDPPLRPNGSIKIGYGTGDEAPLIYTLNEGHDVEVGFFKLFLSTESINCSGIEQISPFTSACAMKRSEAPIIGISRWDDILATVVLRKG